uniref:Uncharacterized protein n=1 Tax=Rhizophora mucronata TaxID=61149 RepID=A0A2P2PK48_RHIMU
MLMIVLRNTKKKKKKVKVRMEKGFASTSMEERLRQYHHRREDLGGISSTRLMK